MHDLISGVVNFSVLNYDMGYVSACSRLTALRRFINFVLLLLLLYENLKRKKEIEKFYANFQLKSGLQKRIQEFAKGG